MKQKKQMRRPYSSLDAADRLEPKGPIEINHQYSTINHQQTNKRLLSEHLRELQGTPLAIHHHIVKEVLDESMLPVVYVNSRATFMENYFVAQKGTQEKNQTILPSRNVTLMAIDHVGEVAAKVLLSGSSPHWRLSYDQQRT